MLSATRSGCLLLRSSRPTTSDLRRSFAQPATSTQALEIERKFRFNPAAEEAVKRVARFHGSSTFRDVYFDDSAWALSRADVWFRKRGEAWECKVPYALSSSPRATSQGVDGYTELTSEGDILPFLKSFYASRPRVSASPSSASSSSPSSSSPLVAALKQLSLLPSIDLTTVRRTYKNDRVTLVFDEVTSERHPTFMYRIGEAEILLDQHDAAAAEEAATAVTRFCETHRLDTKPPLRGKVLQYLWLHEIEHYQALQGSGLVDKKLRPGK